MAKCAVIGCTEEGKPQTCPYDGEKHSHGRIHYECHQYQHFAPLSHLRFKTDGNWYLICDMHMNQIKTELGIKTND